MERINQLLIELFADFLDSDEVITQQILDEAFDPIPRLETELHIRMAKAAMKEYKRTVYRQSFSQKSRDLKAHFFIGFLYPIRERLWNFRFRHFNWTIKKPF